MGVLDKEDRPDKLKMVLSEELRKDNDGNILPVVMIYEQYTHIWLRSRRHRNFMEKLLRWTYPRNIPVIAVNSASELRCAWWPPGAGPVPVGRVVEPTLEEHKQWIDDHPSYIRDKYGNSVK